MKIAIHHRAGSFSDRWIDYCKRENIDYKIVNAFDSNIIEQVKDCNIFMWHHHHKNFKDVIAAKKILFSLEHAGINVFPDFKTSWHFDDKVAQKYLLEAIGAPIVPSYVFYDKKEAIDWAKKTSYPKVFKLKGGSGARNVKLIKNKRSALNMINRSFNKGISQFDKLGNLKERINNFKNGRDNILGIGKAIGRLVVSPDFDRLSHPECGYIYFQDFIENDGFDVRVVVIGDKAVALKRLVRENDFRASGSGKLVFEDKFIDKRYIKIAFDIKNKLKSQSLAIDLVHSRNDDIFAIEISYGFPMLNFLEGSSGYWDNELIWHEGQFTPQYWMIEDLIATY